MAATYPPGPAPMMTTSNGGCWLTKISENIEVFFVKQRIRLHDYVLACPLFDLGDRNEFAALENLGDFRIHPDRDFLRFDELCHFPDLLLNFIADRFRRTHPARAIAM